MPPGAPTPAASFVPEGLLYDLMEVSLTAVNVLRPVHGPTGEIVDFTLDYLNPAAQRMAALPERPGGTLLSHRPNTAATGILDYYRRVFETGATDVFEVNYQAEGLDNYFRLAARRSGEWLVVSFTDTADQPRSAVEVALREAQAAEQAARAEAEAERQRFYEVLQQLPAYVAVYQGPDHVYQFVNPSYQSLFPRRAFAGRPFGEGIPEADGLGVVALFDRVYQTGEPYYAPEMEGWFDFKGTGEPEQVFLNLCLHPLRNAQGHIDGVLDYSHNITEQVLARRQLQQLNQELEARVFERTQALRHAQTEAEATAQQLLRVTESLPSTTFTTDAAGRVLYISPQWYAYTGMVPGTDINAAWPTLIHPDDLPAIAREFGAALAEGRPWGYEFRLRGADGHYRWFASQGVPEPLAEAAAAGRSRHWFGSNLDIDELKQAQRQLEEKDELLTSIISSIPASVVTFEGPDLRFGFFNEAYQQLARGRVRQGRPAVEVFPEVADQGFLAALRQVLHTGEPYQGQDVPAYTRDPRTGQQQDMYLDLAYLPLRHGQQPPHAVLGFIIDVTDRVLARREAEAAQAQALAAARLAATQREAFFRVFEQTPASVALLRGPHHRYEYVNPAYQRLFAGRALLGRPMAEAVPEVQGQPFLAMLDQVFETGETSFGHELRATIAQPGGQPPQEHYFDSTYQALHEDGRIVGISVFAFDVTERVLARRQRETQQAQLQAVFAQAPVAVCVFQGEASELSIVNPSMAEMLGHPLPALVGQPFFEVLPELRAQGLEELLATVRRTGIPFVAREQEIHLARHQPGESGYYNFVYQPLLGADGQAAGIACVATEVTDQVSARQVVEHSARQSQALAHELAAANHQLTRTNVDLDNFIYTASHDLKAPISNIEGLLYLLQEELPAEVAQNAEVGPALARMLDAVERFKRTIDHLTAVSKLQKENAPAATLVNLAAVVEDVRQDLLPLLQAAGARLFVDVSATPPIPFAEKNLRSIVYNLLSNAVKYRHPDRTPHVDVRAHVRPGHTVLEVHDNGLGLAPAHVPRLFTMFQRFHDHVEGTGIGLYMINRMVENAGGRIEVHSQLGAGTTFFVFLSHENTPAGQSIPPLFPS